MDRTKLNRRFHALLGEMGIKDRKEDILSGYGVESSRDLTDEQLRALVDRLEDEKLIRTEGMVKKHRSVILRLLTDMGVYYVVPGERQNACWARVNAFLASPRIAGRELFRIKDEQELLNLTRKLRSMKDNGYYYRADRPEVVPEPPAAKPAAPEIYITVPTRSDGPAS